MAKTDIRQPSKILLPIGGMDESIQVVDSDVTFARVHGANPFYLATLQRLFGKKMISANWEQSVMAISQAFNGSGQYGYYVQTMEKLYYHLCEAPPDFHINFTFATTLGTDEDNNSLGIYGQRRDGSIPPNPAISCVFAFPDIPTPPPEEEENAVFLNFVIIFNTLLTGSQVIYFSEIGWGNSLDSQWRWEAAYGWKCQLTNYLLGGSKTVGFPATAIAATEYAIQTKIKLSEDLATCRVTPTVDGVEGIDSVTGFAYMEFPTGPAVLDFAVCHLGHLGAQTLGFNISFKEISLGEGLPHADNIFATAPLNTVVPPFDSIFTNLGGTPITAAAGVMTMNYPAGGSPRYAYAQKYF